MITAELASAAGLPTLPVAAAVVDTTAGIAMLAALRCLRAELGPPPEAFDDFARRWRRSGSGGAGAEDAEAPRALALSAGGGGALAAAAWRGVASSPPIVRHDVRVFAGSVPLIEQAGLAGQPAALLGLDLLCPPDGVARRLVLDFEASAVWID